jgi:SAM-dependent methyltransferase
MKKPLDQTCYNDAFRCGILSQETIDLDRIYSRRFDAHIAYRNRVWRTLSDKFFWRYVEHHFTVLDLGCGYGEFINNIRCAKKYAMDLNPRANEHLSHEVSFLHQDCSEHWELPDESLDVVFTSNFFEHLPSRQSLSKTLVEAKRCLRTGGLLMALGPNVKFVGGAYWDFWDHHIALTDLSMKEVLEIHGFKVEMALDRFLPYTMVNSRNYPTLLVSLYLSIPLLWRIVGRQFFIVARKTP